MHLEICNQNQLLKLLQMKEEGLHQHTLNLLKLFKSVCAGTKVAIALTFQSLFYNIYVLTCRFNFNLVLASRECLLHSLVLVLISVLVLQ